MEARTMELREARFKRGITQWISLIENGYKASEKEKRALAKGLGVKVEDVSWQNN